MSNQMVPCLQFMGQQPQQPLMDTTNIKIFVGGLARRYFESYGEILQAVVINDKHTGRSKGYGFVLFDVVPSIKFQDVIELISMQPITSSLAAWKRMQDIELMHMRYALESAVFALGAMENYTTAGAGRNEIPFRYLRDLKNHLDAIHSNP